MNSQALITRPLSPSCIIGPCSFGGPLAFSLVRGMMAMLAFQAIRTAACYFFFSRVSSFAGSKPTYGFWPPWIGWQAKLQSSNEQECLTQRMEPRTVDETGLESKGDVNKHLVLAEKTEGLAVAEKHLAREAPRDQVAAPSASSLDLDSASTAPIIVSWTPVLLRALSNLRTTSSSLQTLLASNEKLAAAPATVYLREALTAFVWACDVLEVLAGLMKASA